MGITRPRTDIKALGRWDNHHVYCSIKTTSKNLVTLMVEHDIFKGALRLFVFLDFMAALQEGILPYQ